MNDLHIYQTENGANEEVNGDAVRRNGKTYWMGTVVHQCPKCGVTPTNVDDCGCFGEPSCPYFGIGPYDE